ncbi:uncharacterized protein HD556DRAFT_1450569 [Suillus plorans]|uniref:Uncharacterized protein n=1 Tax=Suillus plorans TaxID=116603 RepID=A0A9P7ACH1_9AGAM|nr:uncharacterized protein HD556DRAFT_1450569 [Suillus plorans]KAG1785600.1 hypothetical protein HD556DRAFT_1450569 [Suillus plorans]
MSRFAVKTPSNRSSSPASSLTCVDLSSSFHKDHAEFKDMDVFGTVHEISLSPSQAQHSLDPPSPPSGTKSPLNLPKSPVKPKSPTRFEPYLKRRATAAATADFAMKSLRGQTAREMNPGAALMAKDIFTRGLDDLPDEMIREGARAQYATCEISRHHLASLTWELEASSRWTSFLDLARKFLKEKHAYSERDLLIWEQTCTNRGVQDIYEDRPYHEYAATEETLTLSVLQEQARQLKQYVEERGVDDLSDDVDDLPHDGADSDGCCYDLPKWGSPTLSQGITFED